jgi:hypothetical protein
MAPVATDRVTMAKPNDATGEPSSCAEPRPAATTLTSPCPATPPPVSLLADSKLVECYWLPTHDKRRQSPLFTKNKHFLRDEVQLPCWICRTRGGPQNPLEVHHIFEWALWNALDPRRMTLILEVLEFYEEGYLAATGPRRATLETALAAAKASGPLTSPDDIRNLAVLCQMHHRGRFTGTHMITFPIWLALAAFREGSGLDRAAIARLATTLKRVDDAVADVVRPTRE